MQTEPAPSLVVTNPDWARRPTGDEVGRYYPEAAWREGVEGAATLSCRVEVTGSLKACAVVSETPAGAGFGDAALRLAPHFKMRPMTVNGQPVDGGSVRIPLAFRLPAEPESDWTDAIVPALIGLAALGFAAWFIRKAWKDGRDPVTGVPVWMTSGRFAPIVDMFEARFEAADGGYIFRPSPKSPGYWTSRAGRDEALKTFVQRTLAVTWGGMIVLFGAMGLAAWLLPEPMKQPDAATTWILPLLFTPIYGLAFLWAWRSAVHPITRNGPVRAALAGAEARRAVFARIGWAQLAGAAIAVGAMLWSMSHRLDLLAGWNRLWLAGAGLVWLGIAAQAFRKWRAEHNSG